MSSKSCRFNIHYSDWWGLNSVPLEMRMCIYVPGSSGLNYSSTSRAGHRKHIYSAVWWVPSLYRSHLKVKHDRIWHMGGRWLSITICRTAIYGWVMGGQIYLCTFTGFCLNVRNRGVSLCDDKAAHRHLKSLLVQVNLIMLQHKIAYKITVWMHLILAPYCNTYCNYNTTILQYSR